MMRGSSRVRVLLSITAVGVVALLGLAACGKSGTQASADDSGYSDLSWDAQALQSIGFSPDQVSLAGDLSADPSATPVPSASAGAKAGGGGKAARLRHRLVRFGFGKKVEHGEATVQTDEGTKTVVVQRGTVTAITATSVTVKSADGYTVAWTFGDKFTVINNKAKVAPSTVAVGTAVGIAGAKDGTATDARLMVVAKS